MPFNFETNSKQLSMDCLHGVRAYQARRKEALRSCNEIEFKYFFVFIFRTDKERKKTKKKK